MYLLTYSEANNKFSLLMHVDFRRLLCSRLSPPRPEQLRPSDSSSMKTAVRPSEFRPDAIHFIASDDDWLIDLWDTKWFHYFNAVFMSLALKALVWRGSEYALPERRCVYTQRWFLCSDMIGHVCNNVVHRYLPPPLTERNLINFRFHPDKLRQFARWI